MIGPRPVVGVLCCNEAIDRPIQSVATRFVAPLSRFSDATVVLVPAVTEAVDIASMALILDGLLLTGSRSNVSPDRYGGPPLPAGQQVDPQRDAVALALADRMIKAGKPVFGICRGLQEINVLFGGTLSTEACHGRHHRGSWDGCFEDLFGHCHDVELNDAGLLATATGRHRMSVNSVHEQGIDRLGGGLSVEAVAADDGLIEAVSARPCGADVLGVQWHPEWDVDRSAQSRAFFSLVGTSLRTSSACQ
ncbi:gamma-glutamyl-gamma-aminobutyrate hydrolase family protein [Sphingomonas aliaeris]|uniref:Gamma-glutamyl-gamma-aminobutyrate hydrolase family protein n=1 Tax=Sphingomonas aliaeris TaxID=2759526 RepID=A0A974S539_9SPHN|nr:gamma-glutamyl-gamma-aminobutyrate hydrolase family protein [Sphingomonas aliaeris]QQV78282.1 gamma-glutamyl-gamma-aminobutyrate hydrolase family protein [Sphingomonas aliaeris]